MSAVTLARSHVVPAVQPIVPPLTEPTQPLAGAVESLLVVDDDDAIRQMLAFRLRRRRGPTAIVASVAEAIELLERAHVDVVVSDYTMPVANGLNLLAYVRARRLDVRFVLVSGALPDGVEELARAAGADVADKSALLDRL